jgi:hypothetical protein
VAAALIEIVGDVFCLHPGSKSVVDQLIVINSHLPRLLFSTAMLSPQEFSDLRSIADLVINLGHSHVATRLRDMGALAESGRGTLLSRAMFNGSLGQRW